MAAVFAGEFGDECRFPDQPEAVDRIDAGAIFVDGARVDGLAPERIAALGVGRTFQTSRVFPALTIWDSVLVGRQLALLRGEGRRLIDPVRETLAVLFGLPFWRRRVAYQEAVAEATLKLFGDRQVSVEPKVISYLVARMERSPEEAVALADLVDRLALARGGAITRRIAAAALAERGVAAEELEGDEDE